MLSEEENRLLTQCGPGTPGGALLRRYWQPAALSEELPRDGRAAPVPVRLLGEDLVLFRDEQAQPGLLGLHCSHRGADLSYGRIEDGGLRCIYHGWLYDIHGRCREQPGEPAFRWTDSGGPGPAEASGLGAQPQPSRFHERIKHTAYPCQEIAGIIFAYLGPGEPPLLPAYDCLTVPDSHRFVTKLYHECNHLQANEGNFDPIHLSFLHRRLTGGSGDGSLAEAGIPPTVEAEETSFGVRVYGIRRVSPDKHYVTIRNFVMPNLTLTATAGLHWHVPIDDTHHWKYSIVYDAHAPIDIEQTRAHHSEMDSSYRLIRRRENRYLQDREEMKSFMFSGLGPNFQAHDACVTEGEGSVQDRTTEHLSGGDVGIMAARRMLLTAIRDVQAGLDPPHLVRDPALNSFPELVSMGGVVPGADDWHTWWQTLAGQYESADVVTR